MNKFYFVFSFLFLSGCTFLSDHERQTSIVKESMISTLPQDSIDVLVALSSPVDKSQPNIFVSALSREVAGYTLVYAKGGNELYILKDKKVIANISDNGKIFRVYGSHPEAPAGGERVIITDKYISYKSPETAISLSGRVFEDHGFDGIDVIYENSDSLIAENYWNGKKCEKTIVAGAACCTDTSGQLRPFKFTPSAGWEISTNPKMIANCQKVP